MMHSIELFAGAGGLGLGLHGAGFRPVNVIEWDSYCCDTIRENRDRGLKAVKGWPVIPVDVRDVNFERYEGKVQMVSGGPPCQPFSLGGKHAAHKDTRDMFSPRSATRSIAAKDSSKFQRSVPQPCQML